MGTLIYPSPGRAIAGDVGVSSDIYSLGFMLYRTAFPISNGISRTCHATRRSATRDGEGLLALTRLIDQNALAGPKPKNIRVQLAQRG